MKMIILSLILSVIIVSCGSKPEGNVITSSPQESAGIVSGTIVSPKNPFSKRVAALVTVLKDGQNSLCTATPISPTILLTAAHCLDNAALIFAFFGNDIAELSKCKSPKNCSGVVRVIAGAKHFDYRGDSSIVVEGDIAVVKLKDPIPQDYVVSELMGSESVETNDLVFLGFGKTSYFSSDAGRLRGVQDRLSSMQRTTKENVTIVGVVCSGDSGGPGFVKSNGKYKILTVNSSVEGYPSSDLCIQKNHSKYVPYYRDWILKQLAALK